MRHWSEYTVKRIEACNQFGKMDRKAKSKKLFIRFVNRKHCIKAFLNNKKLGSISNNKFNFNAKANYPLMKI